MAGHCGPAAGGAAASPEDQIEKREGGDPFPLLCVKLPITAVFFLLLIRQIPGLWWALTRSDLLWVGGPNHCLADL